MDVLLLIFGLVVLTVGAELLIKNASRLAVNLGISPLVVGLTVVAFGTSAPELVVSLHASLKGSSEVALGNVVGSNVFNVLFILGVSALIVPLRVSMQLIRFDVPLMIGVSLLVWLMAWDGAIGRWDGLWLASGVVIYTTWTVVQSRRENKAEVAAQFEAEFGVKEKSDLKGVLVNLFLLAVGLGLLVLGTRFFVESAINIARALKVSELVIGLTIVAVGTSLPEVAASIMAAIRGERDLAVGNVVGSNLFNLLSVLGFSGLIAGQVTVSDEAFRLDLPVMVGVAIACLPVFFTGQIITRWNGFIFLSLYLAYTFYLFLAATDSRFTSTFVNVMLWGVIPLISLGLLVNVVRQISRGNSGDAAFEEAVAIEESDAVEDSAGSQH